MPSVILWLLDGSLVHDDDLAFFVGQLGVSEAHRYICFKRRERQRQFVLGRMLLRFAVANLMALPPDALAVVERDSNAPLLVLPDSHNAQPSFSLSHSGKWVACAVSVDANLGIDIEFNDPTRNICETSHMAFHAKEYLWLLQQPEAMRLSAFYRLWCIREALYKLMSALGRETVSLAVVGENGMLASREAGWYGYTLAHFGLTIAVCCDQPLSALQNMKLTGLSRQDWLALRESFEQITRVPINERYADTRRAATVMTNESYFCSAFQR